MEKYDNWIYVPDNLKTKTTLQKLGIEKPDTVAAVVKTSHGLVNLYNINEAKPLELNSFNYDKYMIINCIYDEAGENIKDILFLHTSGKVLFWGSFSDIYIKWEEILKLFEDYYYISNNFRTIPILCKISKKRKRKLSRSKIYGISYNNKPKNIGSLLYNTYEILEIIYPNADLFVNRKKAKEVFFEYCKKREREGEPRAIQKGFVWMINKLGIKSLKFESLSYEQADKIITALS